MTAGIFMSSGQLLKIEFTQNKKIMRIASFYIILLLFVSCSANKHLVVNTTGLNPNIYGEPRLDVIERIYDNLSENQMPKILSDYYQDLNPSDYSSVEFRVDTTRITQNGCSTSLVILTRKAKDGYLFTNKSVIDKISSLDYDLDNLKISYVYNNREVTTREDVMRILGLRKRRIQISEIVKDEQSETIIVYIFDKNKHKQ